MNVRSLFSRSLAVLALIGGMLSLSGTGAAQETPAKLKTIAFMTDFDVRDDAVGICKAVMNGVAPGVPIIDITHQVTPYSIAEGARFLAGSAPYFPADAVFVVVVDPGVGSTRKAIIAKSRRGSSLCFLTMAF